LLNLDLILIYLGPRWSQFGSWGNKRRDEAAKSFIHFEIHPNRMLALM